MEIRDENLAIKEENDTLKIINQDLKMTEKRLKLDTQLVKRYKKVDEDLFQKIKSKEKFSKILMKIAVDGGALMSLQSTMQRLTTILIFNSKFFVPSFNKKCRDIRRFLNVARERQKHNIGEKLFEKLNKKIKIFLSLRQEEELHYDQILMKTEQRQEKLVHLIRKMPNYYSNFEIFKLKNFWVSKMKKMRDENMEKIYEESMSDVFSQDSRKKKIDESFLDESTFVEENSHFWSEYNPEERKEEEEENEIGIKEAREEHQFGFNGEDFGTVLSSGAKKYYRGDVEGVKTVCVKGFEEMISDIKSEINQNHGQGVKGVIKGVLKGLLFGEEKLI